jgi:hypothetical protein
MKASRRSFIRKLIVGTEPRVKGEWPGLSEEESEGPGGLKIMHDYRSVLAEVLSGALGCGSIDQAFPGYAPQEVGLVKA